MTPQATMVAGMLPELQEKVRAGSIVEGEAVHEVAEEHDDPAALEAVDELDEQFGLGMDEVCGRAGCWEFLLCFDWWPALVGVSSVCVGKRV